jgi:VPDSG-CTERM motif
MRISVLKSGVLAVALLCIGVLSSKATPYEIPGVGQDIPKNGTGTGGGNGNDPSDDFTRLQTVLGSFANSLPTPVYAGYDSNLSSADVTGNDLSGYDYAVLHYGAGNGGTQGSGGGVEVFYLDGAANFDFPSDGTGLNGYGGFSSIVLFKGAPSVPDGGTTVLLLGLGISGFGLLRRKLS